MIHGNILPFIHTYMLNFVGDHPPAMLVSLLNKLYESKLNFYITGSYYFGNYIGASDLDLMCSVDERDIKERLKLLGFKSESRFAQYSDCETTFEWSDIIDIQVVKCLSSKLQIQQNIFDHYKKEYLAMNKNERKVFWNFLKIVKDESRF